MTKAAALHNFFTSFGIDAYPNTAVPAKAAFPRITYEVVFGDWSAPVGIGVNVYYYTESETTPNSMVETISNALADGGKIIPCDGGAIWIKKGAPFAQNILDPTDSSIKRRFINLTLEYLSK